LTSAPRAARSATLVLGLLASVAPAWARPLPPPRLRDFREAEGRISFLQPDNSRTVLELATGTVIERQAGPRPAWPHPPQCDTELADTCRFPTAEVRLDSFVQPALPSHFAVRAETVGWEADYEPPASAEQHLVLRVAGECLLIEDAVHHGTSRLECVDRRSGQSRWVYLYWTRWVSPGDPHLSSGRVQDTLKRMREEADTEESTQYGGTIVLPREGQPRAPRRRIVLDPDPEHGRATRRAVVAGWSTLVLALVAALAWGGTHPWRATSAVIVLAGIVLLAGDLDPALLIAASIVFLTLTVVTALRAPSAQRFALVWTVLITLQLFVLPVLAGGLTRD